MPLRMLLKDINGKDTLTFEPSKEVATLRQDPVVNLTDVDFSAANAELHKLARDGAYDVEITFAKPEKPLEVHLRNRKFRYDPSTKRLSHDHRGKLNYGLPLNLNAFNENGDLRVRLLLDRALIEACWNEGEGPYAMATRFDQGQHGIHLRGQAQIKSLKVFPMKNIWK